MKKYSLFIDESGNLDLKAKRSSLYALCGCAIPEHHQDELEILANQIKFKYWGKTDIVFHSREISRNDGVFSIFKNNPKLKEAFLKDILSLLNKSQIVILPIIVDKQNASKKGWNYIKVIKETAKYLILNYINLLLTKKGYSGEVIIESATAEKDKYYLEMFSYFLSPKCKELNIDFKVMQKKLTSISFVTKQNHDIEEQIADLFAYAICCTYYEKNGLATYKKDSYEAKIIRALNNKLFKKPKTAKEVKMAYYNKIESFKILPEMSPKK